MLNTSLSAKIIKENLLFILLNFPTPNIVLFFAGCFAIFRFSTSHALRNVLLGVTILFFVFEFRYTVPDRYAFFIPFYCTVAVFMGLGTHLFQKHIGGKVFGPGRYFMASGRAGEKRIHRSAKTTKYARQTCTLPAGCGVV